MIVERAIRREEIGQIWLIDRSEVIDNVYYIEDGRLVLKPGHFDMRGWPPGEGETYTPLLIDCHDRGGWFHGLFEDGELIGVAILENRFIGKPMDMLQLVFLHLSQAYRHQGLGKHLFEMAAAVAREKGAKRLYISATPSEHTIHFYLGLGCSVTSEPDPELFALEPEDIHLECEL